MVREPDSYPKVMFTVCVFTAVSGHFGWVNAEHEFRVWVTILGRMSHHFHFFFRTIIYLFDVRPPLKG